MTVGVDEAWCDHTVARIDDTKHSKGLDKTIKEFMAGGPSPESFERSDRKLELSVADLHPVLNRSEWREGVSFLVFAVLWNSAVSFGVIRVIAAVRSEILWLAKVSLALFAIPFVLGGLGFLCIAFCYLFKRRETFQNLSLGTM